MSQSVSKQNFIKAIPGIIILVGILCLSLLWAGVKPVGFGVAHFFSIVALSVSFFVTPVKFNFIQQKKEFNVLLFIPLVFTINLVIHNSAYLGFDVIFLVFDMLIALYVISVTPKRSLKILLITLFILGILTAILHIALLVGYRDPEKMPGYLKHANHYGTFAILIIFPALGRFLGRPSSRVSYLALITAILNMICVFVDVKTGPIVIAFIGLFVLGYNHRQASKRAYRVLILLVVFVLALAFVHLSDWLFVDVQKTLQIEDPTEYHLFPMRTAYRMIVDNPVWGVGIGNFRYLSSIYKDPEIVYSIQRAHNVFIELLSELGLVFFSISLICVYYFFKKILQKPSNNTPSKSLNQGILTALFLMIPSGIWDFGPQMPANSMMISVIIGILVVGTKRHKSSQYEGKSLRSLFWCPVLLLPLTVLNIVSGYHYEKGSEYERIGLLKSAQREYEKAVRLNNLDDRYLTAAALMGIRLIPIENSEIRLTESSVLIEKSLARNPRQPRLYYAKTKLSEYQQKRGEAEWVSSIQAAIKFDPNNIMYQMDYVKYLIETDQKKQAVEILDRITTDLSGAQLNSFVSSFLDVWNSPVEMELYLKNRIGVWNYKLFYKIVRMLKKEGLDILVRSLVHDASREYSFKMDSETLSDLVVLCFNLQLEDTALEAMNVYERKYHNDDMSFELYSKTGDYFVRNKNNPKAVQWFEKAIENRPDNPVIRLKLIKALYAQDDSYPIRQKLEALVENYPDVATLHYNLAKTYEKDGMHLQALREYRKANQLSSNRYKISSDRLENSLDIPDFWKIEYKDQ